MHWSIISFVNVRLGKKTEENGGLQNLQANVLHEPTPPVRLEQGSQTQIYRWATFRRKNAQLIGKSLGGPQFTRKFIKMT